MRQDESKVSALHHRTTGSRVVYSTHALLLAISISVNSALLVLIDSISRHSTGKYSGRDSVDSNFDTGVGAVHGEHFRQLDSRCLRGVVRHVVLGDLELAADGGDIDDAA